MFLYVMEVHLKETLRIFLKINFAKRIVIILLFLKDALSMFEKKKKT